jgi:hypothetical protein
MLIIRFVTRLALCVWCLTIDIEQGQEIGLGD